MQTIMHAENVSKQFGRDQIINDISIDFFTPSFTAILGQSGSGKSTLLNLLSGQLRPTSGCIYYKDINITKFTDRARANWKRTEISNVFQNYLLLNNLTAKENINIAIVPGKSSLPLNAITEILDIQDILDKFPAQLSGGQQQRVAIARAVIKYPSILFCDEATGALDETNSKNVISMLHKLKNEFNISILFTTHNAQIAKTADRIISIKDGKIAGDRKNRKPIDAFDMVWG